MNHIHEALMWRGITPPPEGSRKTTCPMCSHTRAKSSERCLSIYPGNQWISWQCHHCGWADGEPVQVAA